MQGHVHLKCACTCGLQLCICTVRNPDSCRCRRQKVQLAWKPYTLMPYFFSLM